MLGLPVLVPVPNMIEKPEKQEKQINYPSQKKGGGLLWNENEELRLLEVCKTVKLKPGHRFALWTYLANNLGSRKPQKIQRHF
jgi:hypothetical protein